MSPSKSALHLPPLGTCLVWAAAILWQQQEAATRIDPPAGHQSDKHSTSCRNFAIVLVSSSNFLTDCW